MGVNRRESGGDRSDSEVTGEKVRGLGEGGGVGKKVGGQEGSWEGQERKWGTGAKVGV